MRNTYVKDPGGWNYAQKNSEVGPGGGAGYADPGPGGGFPKDPGGGMGMNEPGGGGL
ncbi:hypothetical protein NKS28_13680 [Bacillus sp. 1663tsa1]|uniref:hypothetical protein n=1 Tax=Bacillus sp. 1663tsa1 TaxID=2953804 RepID=UPI00209E40E5|nr:hypothetical protein [Bacillus sp. 1663tsa1]MCP1178527.1 hypothetical protein [Bacillus sp. 1663tsa1]